MAFDLFCAPLVLLLAVCPWRFYAFWSGVHNTNVVDTVCAGIFPADVITDHPSCWRFKALKNVVLMAKDVLSLPFLCFSIFSWRNPFYYRTHRVQTIWTLQKIQADARADRVASAPSSSSVPLLRDEISVASLIVNKQVTGGLELPASPSPPQAIAPNTAQFLSESPPQSQASASPAAPLGEQAVSAEQVKFNEMPASVPDATSSTSSISSSSSTSSPIPSPLVAHAGDTLPWFDPVTMDWYVDWRSISLIQTFLLLLDFLTLPFLAFYLASIYRVCLFPPPASQLIPSEENLNDRISSLIRQGKTMGSISYTLAEDWGVPFRCILLNHTVCIVFDILCFPFFVIAKLSWRGHTLQNNVNPQPISAAKLSWRGRTLQSNVSSQAANDLGPPASEFSLPGSLESSEPIDINAPSAETDAPPPVDQSNNPNHIDAHPPSLFVCIRDEFLNEVHSAAFSSRLLSCLFRWWPLYLIAAS